MEKRHSFNLLYAAIAASAVVSIGIATVTTAQLVYEHHLHNAAPVSAEAAETEQQKQVRESAAATEKAARQQIMNQMKLHELRQGN